MKWPHVEQLKAKVTVWGGSVRPSVKWKADDLKRLMQQIIATLGDTSMTSYRWTGYRKVLMYSATPPLDRGCWPRLRYGQRRWTSLGGRAEWACKIKCKAKFLQGCYTRARKAWRDAQIQCIAKLTSNANQTPSIFHYSLQSLSTTFKGGSIVLW